MTKTAWLAVWWALIVALWSPARIAAVEVLDPDYAVEEYVTIEGPSYGMTFDDAGNLYVLHRVTGRITKVTPGREVSVLTTIPPKPGGDVVSLIWTGGSAFGDFLYALRRHPHSDLIRIDPEVGTWTAIASIFHDCGTHLGLDRVGLYGGHLYTGTGCRDRMFRITAGGNVSVFSAWPHGTDGGGPRGIDFDPSGRYGSHMYVASAYASYASHVSGLFRLGSAGNATRFADAIVLAYRLLFAPAGPMFDQEMFVYGRVDYSALDSVWRISPDGTPEEFVRGIDNTTWEASHAIAFGPDGALYVGQYFSASNLTTIHRVFSPPDPVSLAIFRLKRAIDEKTVAIQAIEMALADELAALEALEGAPPKHGSLLVDSWVRLSMERQRESRQSLRRSRRLLLRAVELLESLCTEPPGCPDR